jgi:hypothetical protein
MGLIRHHEEGKTFEPQRGWPPARSDAAGGNDDGTDDPWIPSVPGCFDANDEASCP